MITIKDIRQKAIELARFRSVWLATTEWSGAPKRTRVPIYRQIASLRRMALITGELHTLIAGRIRDLQAIEAHATKREADAMMEGK